MSQKQKLIARLKSNPKDFSFDEAATLLENFGFKQCTMGKTSGSRVAFTDNTGQKIIRLHKPHPGNILRNYQIKQLTEFLTQEGLI